MEEEKLQRLHDTLTKLQPRGKSGGLGLGGFRSKQRDATLPTNALYSNFVREGYGKKRSFDESDDDKKGKCIVFLRVVNVCANVDWSTTEHRPCTTIRPILYSIPPSIILIKTLHSISFQVEVIATAVRTRRRERRRRKPKKKTRPMIK